MIPAPLQNKKYRFVLLKANSKVPFENEWQTKNNYAFDDTILISHISKGGNVGLIGGFGGIFIIDDDTGKLSNDLKDILHDTYQERTWSGKVHFIGETDYTTNHVFKDGLGELRVNEYQAVISPSTIEGKKYQSLNDKPVEFFSKEKLLQIINPYLRIQNVNALEKESEPDNSRSGKEYKEVCRLIARGLSKEAVFEEMKAFKKWTDAHSGYRELTYNNAKKFIDTHPIKKKTKNSGETDQEVIETSLYINQKEGIMAEQILQEGVSKFCVYDSKTNAFEVKFDLNINGVIYKPLNGDEVIKEAIKLPSGPEEYGAEADLDNQIKKHITKWLDIPDDVLQFAIWNIKRSWVFDRFHTLNYLRALGDTGQGKSRFLDTLGSIHYKPLATSGATTAAPIFRMIERWRGTLIMDEADFQKSDESQDIIKIINQGYERGKWIMRCDQNDSEKIGLFDPFCPKIIATRRAFEDKAVESRCITQVMKGTNRLDIPFNINDSFWKDALKIRNMLLMWRFKNYFTINPDIIPESFDYGNLEPRVKQIISSFVSLFANDRNQLEAFKTYILDYQESLIEERKDSFDGVIVGSVWSLIDRAKSPIENVNISSQDIIDEGQLTDYKGNPLKPRGLVSHMKSLGFGKPIIKKVDGKTKKCIVLNKDHLTNIFKRYGYQVTIVTVLRDGGADGNGGSKMDDNDDVKNVACPPYNRNNSNSVTLGKPNLYQAIKELDKGKGAEMGAIQKLMMCSDKDFEEYVKFARMQGKVFEEPRGYLRLLE